MKLSTEAGDKPLWRQLYEVIQKRIECGEYGTGQTIPSEKEFIEEFGISRITVRQAMDKLVSDGFVCRQRGKGTVVNSTKIDLSTILITSMSTLQEVNNSLNRITESVETVNAPLEIARMFDIEEDSSLICVKRYSNVEGEIIAIYETYLNPRFIKELDSAFDSLYQNIRDHLGKTIDSFTDEVIAGTATFEEQRYFAVALGIPILIRKRKGYIEGNLVEFTTCKYRGDRYKMIVQAKQE